MRLSFVFHPKMIRLPFDGRNLQSDPRGLTGSEGTFFRLAEEMWRRGHVVDAFAKFAPGTIDHLPWTGVHFWDYERWGEFRQEPDAAISYISADPLSIVPAGKTLRIVHQQCRGWSMSSPGWEEHVDFACALSNVHARELAEDSFFPKARFRILHDGVDLEQFRPGEKVPGRVLWASSPERGLHRLLECWPKIKRVAPHAHLRIRYDMHSLDNTPDPENRARAAYIKAAVAKLGRAGVEVAGSGSREDMMREMAEAEVLAYPLETSDLVETFGVTVLEACAAGAVPVLCFGDAFGELWKGHVLGVDPPIAGKLDEFAKIVSDVLLHPDFREERAKRCRAWAEEFSWEKVASGLEEFVKTRGASGLSYPEWEAR